MCRTISFLLIFVSELAFSQGAAEWLFTPTEYLPGQMNRSSCQSNIIAVALLHAGYNSKQMTGLNYSHDLSKKQEIVHDFIRSLEDSLRNELLSIRNSKGLSYSTRSDWAEAVKRITNNSYKLQGSDVENGKFYTFLEFNTFVAQHFKNSPSCDKPNLISCLTSYLSNPSRPPILITSTTGIYDELGYQNYRKSGHIIGILNSRYPKTKYQSHQVEIYALNTFQRLDTSPTCNRGDWRGRLGWLRKYEIKGFLSSERTYTVNWIEKEY